VSIQDRVRDAERRVDRAEGAVDNAERELCDAKEALDEIEEVAEKETIEEATGPQKAIGERVVRVSCSLGELPEWFHETDANGVLRCLRGERLWATNGHVMIDVDSVDGLEVVKADPAAVIGKSGALLVRADTPVKVSGILCRDFGTVAVQLRYATLVEDLFPGCEWRSTGGDLSMIHAVVNGTVVAAVMPVRRTRAAA